MCCTPGDPKGDHLRGHIRFRLQDCKNKEETRWTQWAWWKVNVGCMQHGVRMTPSIQSFISLQKNQWVLYIITISHSVPWQFYMGSSPAMSQSIYTISYAWLILAMLSGQACLRGCRTKKWQIHKYSTAKLPTRIQFTYMYISLTNLVIMVLNLERIQVLIYTRNGSDLNCLRTHSQSTWLLQTDLFTTSDNQTLPNWGCYVS